MLRAILTSLLSRKLRLGLSAFAVVLGVMFVSGAFVLTDTLSRSFDDLFATTTRNVDVQVSGRTSAKTVQGVEPVANPIPASLLTQVADVPGIASVTGEVFAEGVRMVGRNGKVLPTSGPPQFGTNWTGNTDVVAVRSGRAPAAPNEIVINAGLARTAKYGIGDQVGVLALAPPKRTFTIVGIFGYSGGRDTLGGEQTIAFTTPTAQQLLLGKKDVYSAVQARGDDGVSQETLRDRVREAVGDRYLVRTGKQVAEQQAGDVQDFLGLFNRVLLGFAAVALFVGIFLILNTFSMLVAQRTRELALMRALGASRRQTMVSVLIEALVVGVIGSVLGLAAGIGIGFLMAWMAARYFADLPLAGVGVPPVAVVASVLVGVVVTIVAALVPAVRASRIPPIAAMRDAATPDRPLTRITLVGAVVFIAGAAALGVALSGNAGDATTRLLLVGVLVTFVGIALLTPLISRPVVSLLGRGLSWSVPGRLGRLNSARNPRRTAVTAAALMVGLALVTGVAVVTTSAKTSFTNIVDRTITAELLIAGQQNSPIPPTFDSDVLAEVREDPDVSEVVGIWVDPARVDGAETFVAAADDTSSVSRTLGVTAVSGTLSGLSGTQVALDENTADRQKLTVGDTVRIQLSRGAAQTFTLTCVYRSEAFNGWLVSTDQTPNFRVNAPTEAFIKVRDGASVSAVESRTDTLLKDSPEVTVQDVSAFVEQQMAILDTFLRVIQTLLGLAILIAILGIVNTLALSVIERTREIGLLRAIGLRRAQTMRMIIVEAVVISLFGAVLGLAVGAGLGTAVVQALQDEGFTDLAFPWGQMVTYLVVAGMVGVLAAVVPGLRAARTNVLNAIAYE